MRFRSLCLLAILSLLLPVFESSVFGQQEESEVPESPAGHVQFITLHSDGEVINKVATIQIEGADPVETQYTVMIPYTEDGVTKHRAEIRTMMRAPTKRVLQPIGEATFIRLDGTEVDKQDLLKSFPMTGLKVVYFPPGLKQEDSEELLDNLRDILKDSVILMKPKANP